MSQVKFRVAGPCEMTSVLTTESLEELGVKKGDGVNVEALPAFALDANPSDEQRAAV